MAAVAVTSANTNSLLNSARSVFRDSNGVPYVLSFQGTTIEVSVGLSEINKSLSNYYSLYNGNYVAVGQSLTGKGKYIGEVFFYLTKSGSPTGSVIAKIYAHSGTYGTSSIPSGTALATSNEINSTSITSGWCSFTFSTPIFLEENTYYIITVEYSGGNSSNNIQLWCSISDVYSGNMCTYTSGWSAAGSFDVAYKVLYINETSFKWEQISLASAGTVLAGVSGAIDSTDVIHISWLDDAGAASKLKYATFTCSSSTFSSITTINSDIGGDPTDTSLYTAIAVDANNIPHIAYNEYPSIMGAATYTSMYTNKVGGSWNTAVQVRYTQNYNCVGLSITIDLDNLPFITHVELGQTYRFIGNANNATSFTAGSCSPGSSRTDSVIDDFGNHYAVAFYDATVLRIFKHTRGNTWSTETAYFSKTLTTIAALSSISAVIVGNIMYVFYEDVNNDICYITKDITQGTGSAWGDVRLISQGTFNTVISKYSFFADNDSEGDSSFYNFGAASSNYSFGIDSSYEKVGFSINTIGGRFRRLSARIVTFGIPTDSVICKIYTGGWESTLIYTSNNMVGGIFSFSSTISLTNGVTYYFVFERTGSLDSNNYYSILTYTTEVHQDTSNLFRKQSGSWNEINTVSPTISIKRIPKYLEFIYADETATPDIYWSDLPTGIIDGVISGSSSVTGNCQNKQITTQQGSINTSSTTVGVLKAKGKLIGTATPTITTVGKISSRVKISGQIGSIYNPLDTTFYSWLNSSYKVAQVIETNGFGISEVDLKVTAVGFPLCEIRAGLYSVNQTTNMPLSLLETSNTDGFTDLEANFVNTWTFKFSGIPINSDKKIAVVFWLEYLTVYDGSNYLKLNSSNLNYHIPFSYTTDNWSTKVDQTSLGKFRVSTNGLTAILSAKSKISGSATPTITVTGSLKGKGRITATATPTITVTGILKAKGKLSEDITYSISVTGVLKGKGRISSTISGITTTVGVLSSKNLISGSINTSSNTSGFIGAKVKLFGEIVNASSIDVVLKAKGKLYGTISTSSNVTGTSIIPVSHISGPVDTSSSVSASIKAKGKLLVTVNTLSSSTGVIKGEGKILVSVSTNTTTVALIQAKGKVLVTIDTSSSTSLILKAKGKLIGTIANSTSTVGQGIKRTKIYGTTDGVTSTVGFLQTKRPISGNATPTITVQAVLKAKGKLYGSLTGATTTVGFGVSKNKISGTISNVTSIIGVIIAKGKLLGSVDSVCSVYSVLKAKGKLYGTVENSTSTVGQGIKKLKIYGTVDTSSSVSGAIRAKGRLIVSIDTSTSTIGVLIADGKLYGQIDTNSSISGTVRTDGQLIVNVSGSSNTLGILKGKGYILGSISTLSIVNGTGQTKAYLVSSTSGSSSTEGIGYIIFNICPTFDDSSITFDSPSWTLDSECQQLTSIVSSSTGVSATIGVLKAKGNISVLVNTSTTTAGIASAKGKLLVTVNTGSSTLLLLKAKGRLLGSVDSSSSTVGQSWKRIKIYSAVNTLSSTIGVLIARGRISVQINTITTTAGVLLAKGKLIGNSSGVTITVGVLVSEAITVGIINTYSSTSATIKAKGKLLVQVYTSSSVTLVTKAKGKLFGTSNSLSIVEAYLSAYNKAVGAINCTSTTSGTVKGKGLIVGAINGVSQTAGLVRSKGKLISLVSTLTNTIGILKGKGKILGAVSGLTITEGFLQAEARLVYAINTSTTTNASLKGKGKLAGIISCNSVTLSAIKSRRRLYGTITPSTSTVSNLIAEGKLVSSTTTYSEISAAILGMAGCIGQINGYTVVDGRLYADGKLVSTVNVYSEVSGFLNKELNYIAYVGSIPVSIMYLGEELVDDLITQL